jgi:hypothetical protein
MATQAEVNGLAPGTYYFAAFAYNAAGESLASNEVQYVQAAPVPTPSPTATPTPTPSPAPSGLTIEADKHSLKPGESFEAIVRNGPANRTDWVALVPVNSWPDEDPYNTWKYLNGKRGGPAVGISNTSLTFVAPPDVGVYELRFFENNGYNILDVSDPIIVSTPNATPMPELRTVTVKTDTVTVKTEHLPGEQITISAPANVNGKPFQSWTGDTGALANPQSNQTTLTVPISLDVEVEATY